MKEVQPPKRPIMFYYAIALAVIMLFNLVIMPGLVNQSVKEVPYSDFLDMLDRQQLSQVYIDSAQNQISFTDKALPEPQLYVTGIVDDPGLVERLNKVGVTYTSPIIKQASPLLTLLLSWVIPIGIFMLLGNFLTKQMTKKMGGGMNAMQLGKSNARIYIQSETGIKFADVAGQDEAKEALQEIVEFLHNPGKYAEIGATLPKGALLVGPPGTGKTLLAKAVAGEAEVPFFSISGSEFVEMFVGMGASKVRDLFKQAEEKAPCIVFIDEIDTIGKKRESTGLGGGNDEREQTLNQLLAEMDGFDGKKGVVLLAATNRPEILDPALLRPGRFDRRIPVELPDLQGRIDILKVHIKKVKTDPGINLSTVARAAAGTSGADLANIINEAALRAVREGRKRVNQVDLEESIEVVLAGYQKKSQVLSDKEKLIVAYHETGHALVAAKQKESAPVHKITIIPRTSGALGYTMQVEEDEHFLTSKEEIENKIATYTAGRVAEDVVFGAITTGAANDIERATQLARAMITRLGMTDEFGMVSFEQEVNPYLGGQTVSTGSAETSSRVDQMTIDLVKKQYDRAETIIRDNLPKLHELAKFLYEKETISGEEFMSILNSPPALLTQETEAQEGEEQSAPAQV
ncbi:MAG: ATP-dependent zinc metalloprotease FtsH [Eubacteriales bacterium]|jgi:cell division protease FtsH|nr:ATP-dependent zinc metalloprotease FtsH [Eubacteriales bacterium]MDD4105386.1 ATP-dependent zinc metalloprotease FtsH [Eubacteriales bacterium]MDD4709877.1 ATP-dependent zinc metalloprotease FtsH [Eubacteriales bacterium]NLO15346.1 ATP-dependent zinc metalloprotease FtsH [Clostridiales bacterium]